MCRGSGTPSGMMAVVRVSVRGAVSTASVGFVVIVAGLAAWLGVSQAPPGLPLEPSPWEVVLNTTRAAGPLDFSMVVRSSGTLPGEENSVVRTLGVADFSGFNAQAVTVSRSPGLPAQWIQSLVVGGRSYARFGSDLGGRPRFSGPWIRSAGFSTPPLGALAGSAGTSAIPGPVHLTQLARVTLSEETLTKYLLSSVQVSCPGGAIGRPTTELDRSVAWVDGAGRLRRFETVTVQTFTIPNPGTVRTVTVTSFGPFGATVEVTPPTRVTGPPVPAKVAQQGPFAGCLVTPR